MPDRYLGPVMDLLRDRRGENIKFDYLAVGRVDVTADLPLAEVLFDFYDRLKSMTQGYGSFDYEVHRLPADRSGESGHSGKR